MREKVTLSRLQQFMKALGAAARAPGRVYLVGGATCVLMGWRSSTIDVDLKIVPDSHEILRTLPALKEQLHLNIELASPDDFIPELPGWQERSRFVGKEGSLEFFHYDFYGQALAKIERDHTTDRGDVELMLQHNLVNPERLLQFFGDLEDALYKYPAVDAASFRQAVERVVREAKVKNN